MDQDTKKMSVTGTLEGKAIVLSDITVKIEYDGHTAEVDAETAIKRSLHLVYENQILRQALSEAKAVFDAQKQTGNKIILPGSE